MSELLQQTIEKIAAEKFPDNAEEATNFIKGFQEKVAAYSSPELGDSISKGFGEQLGRGAVGTAISLGISGVAHLVNGVKNQALHNNFLKALNEAVQMNVILKKADRQKLLSYGETLFRFAPHVATDPNMLAHLLSNAVQGEGMDAQTIRLAADLENRYQQNTSIDTRNYS